MKKGWMILALICLLLLCTHAIADGGTSITFSTQSGAVNGGFPYTLQVQVNPAPKDDLIVTLQRSDTEETLSLTIPAGSTAATMELPTQVTERQQKVKLTLVAPEGYKVGKPLTLTVYPLPKVQFYLNVNFGTVGKQMSVVVTCKNPATILKGNRTFTLRDTDGTVLCTKEWGNPSGRLTFQFDATEAMIGRHDMSVWLGDQQVSIEDGYGSVSLLSNPPVVSLQPSIPVMGIGIDCGFNGRKTDEILAVLDKYQVKCTFFMTGYFLREFTEEAQKILAAGHEIASHSNTHKHLKELDTYSIFKQITIPITEAEERLGVTPRLFRPPYGEYNGYITSISRSEGMEVIMWSATAHDSTGRYTHEEILRCATTGNDFQPGSILLMHLDGTESPKTLDVAIPYYQSLGLQVVPISALLYASGRELPAMPAGHEALVYTNDYWRNWLRNNLPEYADMLEQQVAEEKPAAEKQ